MKKFFDKIFNKKPESSENYSLDIDCPKLSPAIQTQFKEVFEQWKTNGLIISYEVAETSIKLSSKNPDIVQMTTIIMELSQKYAGTGSYKK